MANDWYRKTTWNEADRADFFARLGRSRTACNKAQYLRIQAGYLEGADSSEFLQAAISLLDKMIVEFPELSELASAYGQKASCLAKLGNIDQAVVYYRRALEVEKEFPGVKTNVFIEFAKLVAENNLASFFSEALAVLEEELNSREIKFPSDIYHAFGIRSLIAARCGEFGKAKEFAKIALEAATKIHSGFRYHPTVGLVGEKETSFFKSVAAIATK